MDCPWRVGSVNPFAMTVEGGSLLAADKQWKLPKCSQCLNATVSFVVEAFFLFHFCNLLLRCTGWFCWFCCLIDIVVFVGLSGRVCGCEWWLAGEGGATSQSARLSLAIADRHRHALIVWHGPYVCYSSTGRRGSQNDSLMVKISWA